MYNQINKLYCEQIKIDVEGIVFVVKTESRPDEYPDLKFKKMKKFYHIGIIYDGVVYETFNKGRYNINDLSDELERVNDDTSVFLNSVPINLNKLNSEIKSGTSCDEYVARVTGISDRVGNDKGDLFPVDVFRELSNLEQTDLIKLN